MVTTMKQFRFVIPLLVLLGLGFGCGWSDNAAPCSVADTSYSKVETPVVDSPAVTTAPTPPVSAHKRFALHPGKNVAECVVQQKPNRRTVRISTDSFSTAMRPFFVGEVPFVSISEFNDLWLDLNFDDQAFEKSLAEHIQRLLGRRYAPLKSAQWS
jgi:hypothetical protein